MTYTRLVFLAPRREQASRYVIVDPSGGEVTHGVLTPGAVSTKEPLRDVLIIPGEEALVRRLTLTGDTPAQVKAAALIAVQEKFGVAPDAAHLALTAAAVDGARWVCVVGVTAMRDLLSRTNDLGVYPVVACPDAMMLPAPEAEGATVADLGGRVLVRQADVAFAADPDLADQILARAPRRDIGVEGIERACSGELPVNLLQGMFAPAGDRPKVRDFRMAAVLAALLLLSPVIGWTAQIARHELAARSLEKEARVAALAALPGENPVDPVRAVTARAAQIAASRSLVRATAALFASVEQTPGAEVDQLYYQQDGSLRASLVHDNFSDAPGLAARLRQAGYDVREDGASETPAGRITTALSVRVRP